tara:strand:+ start:1059 stop:1226 length:168 start_codon:yes stop_codon:yes gene_type:complete
MICDECFKAHATISILSPMSEPVLDVCDHCFDMNNLARLHPWVPIEDTFVPEVEA